MSDIFEVCQRNEHLLAKKLRTIDTGKFVLTFFKTPITEYHVKDRRFFETPENSYSIISNQFGSSCFVLEGNMLVSSNNELTFVIDIDTLFDSSPTTFDDFTMMEDGEVLNLYSIQFKSSDEVLDDHMVSSEETIRDGKTTELLANIFPCLWSKSSETDFSLVVARHFNE